jgi:hypothetical protein
VAAHRLILWRVKIDKGRETLFKDKARDCQCLMHVAFLTGVSSSPIELIVHGGVGGSTASLKISKGPESLEASMPQSSKSPTQTMTPDALQQEVNLLRDEVGFWTLRCEAADSACADLGRHIHMLCSHPQQKISEPCSSSCSGPSPLIDDEQVQSNGPARRKIAFGTPSEGRRRILVSVGLGNQQFSNVTGQLRQGQECGKEWQKVEEKGQGIIGHRSPLQHERDNVYRASNVLRSASNAKAFDTSMCSEAVQMRCRNTVCSACVTLQMRLQEQHSEHTAQEQEKDASLERQRERVEELMKELDRERKKTRESEGECARLRALCQAFQQENSDMRAEVCAWDEACKLMTKEGDALKREIALLKNEAKTSAKMQAVFEDLQERFEKVLSERIFMAETETEKGDTKRMLKIQGRTPDLVPYRSGQERWLQECRQKILEEGQNGSEEGRIHGSHLAVTNPKATAAQTRAHSELSWQNMPSVVTWYHPRQAKSGLMKLPPDVIFQELENDFPAHLYSKKHNPPAILRRIERWKTHLQALLREVKLFICTQNLLRAIDLSSSMFL